MGAEQALLSSQHGFTASHIKSLAALKMLCSFAVVVSVEPATDVKALMLSCNKITAQHVSCN